MIGMAAVKKAAKKGYKKYGLPGAIVAGLGTFLGIRFLKRKLQSRGSGTQNDETGTGSDTTN